MSTVNASTATPLIASAGAFLGNTHARPDAPANTWVPSQQRAMLRRLKQIDAALGNATTSHDPTRKAPSESRQAGKKTFGTVALVLTATLSTLLGAGTTRLLMAQEPIPPTAVTASQFAVSPPATTEAPAPAPSISDNTRAKELVEAWRTAWMQRDVAGYLSAYSQDFTPADGNSREKWVAARTQKLASGAPIDLQIHHLAIERIDARQFRASFIQDYAAGNYREQGRAKTLLITREGDAWKIAREWQDEPKLAMK